MLVFFLVTLSGVMAQPIEGLPVAGRITTTTPGISPTVEYFYRSSSGSTLRIEYKGADDSSTPVQGWLWDAKARKTYRIQYGDRTFYYLPRVSMMAMGASVRPFPGEPFRDVVNGVPCELYPRVPVDMTENSSCYSQKFAVTVQSKNTHHGKRGDSVSIMTFSDLHVDSDHDESFFQIPEGFTEVPNPMRHR